MIRAVSNDLLRQLKAETSDPSVVKLEQKAKNLKRPLAPEDSPTSSSAALKAGKARVFAKLPTSSTSSP